MHSYLGACLRSFSTIAQLAHVVNASGTLVRIPGQRTDWRIDILIIVHIVNSQFQAVHDVIVGEMK